MITLPWLKQASVRLICATLFTPHDKPEPERRYKLFSQLEMYREWFERYPAELRLVLSQGDLATLGAEQASAGNTLPIGVVLLMEGCDLLGNAAEMQTWFERG